MPITTQNVVVYVYYYNHLSLYVFSGIIKTQLKCRGQKYLHLSCLTQINTLKRRENVFCKLKKTEGGKKEQNAEFSNSIWEKFCVSVSVP